MREVYIFDCVEQKQMNTPDQSPTEIIDHTMTSVCLCTSAPCTRTHQRSATQINLSTTSVLVHGGHRHFSSSLLNYHAV